MENRQTVEGSPLRLGTVVKPYGRISSVGSIEGERYYWLTDEDGSVAMMPADVIEGKIRPDPAHRSAK